jgi:type I restriction enzyme S subunit
MAIEWTIVPLSTVAKVQSGFAFKSADMGESGCPVIKIKNINPPNVDVTDVQRVPLAIIEENRRIDRFKLTEGDVLIAMTGATVGKVGRMPQSSEAHYLNQRVGKVFLTDQDAADYDYVYYVLSQSGHVDQMLGLADGSAQPNISGAQIESLEIPLPPLPEQKAIAHILGSLDDKIELNRRMNETLEGMAQALFKSWFVDFDPVIDNALEAGNPIPEEFADRAETRRHAITGRGEAPASPSSTSASDVAGATSLPEQIRNLFPASFIETDEMGWIPEGWRSGKISDLCKAVQSGGTPKRAVAEYWNGNIKWLSSGEVRDVIVLSTKETITQLGVDKSSAKIWPKHTTVIAMYGATAGQVCFLGTEMTANQACCALIPTASSKCFVFMASRRSSGSLLEQATGSAQQNLNKSLVANNPSVIPPEEILSSYEASMFPLMEKWIENLKENQTLAKLRDTLLPKLISGEVRTVKGEG